jgi:two-component system, cell cycle response regulator
MPTIRVRELPSLLRRSPDNDMYSTQTSVKVHSLPAPQWVPMYDANPKPAASERRHRPGQFRRVLIAESDQVSRASLEKMFRNWGFDVVLAKNSREALQVLRDEKPLDFAILGRALAGMNGIELCRRINEQPYERMPYLFVLSNRGEAGDVVEALESGADEYLTVPIDERELKARLAAASRILKRRDELISAREAFRDQAVRDALTGVWTRRAILEILEADLSRASGKAGSTGVLLLDLDHFKNVNDTYGHLAGDQVLAEATRRLSRQLRSYDSIGRYGGEEFLVVAPGCDQKELCELAERLRSAIESEPMHAGQHEITVTLSIGVAIASTVDGPATSAIESADVALYAAKKAGRNRFVCCAPRPKSIPGSLFRMPAQIALQPVAD